jgi:hypothetical protein
MHFTYWNALNNPRGKPTRHLEEYIFLTDENHPFSNFPLKYLASLGKLNPIEIKANFLEV